MADKSAWASLFVFMAGEAYRFLSEERVAGLSASRNAAGTVLFLYRYIGVALPYGMGRPDCSNKVQKMCLERMSAKEKDNGMFAVHSVLAVRGEAVPSV